MAAANQALAKTEPKRFEELVEADEVFLTNSLIGAWPVSRFGERRCTPGPITRRVQALIAEHDAHVP